jgi:hypothetical protein
MIVATALDFVVNEQIALLDFLRVPDVPHPVEPECEGAPAGSS